MKNLVQAGGSIDYTNATGSAIVAGQMVRVGAMVGVASTDIAISGVGSLAITNVYALPKVDAAVIAAGETVDFDFSAQAVDDNAMTPASGDVSNFGIAFETKGATTGETINVLLTPGTGTHTP